TQPANVFIVEVAKASILTTLDVKSGVEGLAFSPDGKWLAVGARPSIPAGTAPVGLVVVRRPAFPATLHAHGRRDRDRPHRPRLGAGQQGAARDRGPGGQRPGKGGGAPLGRARLHRAA